MRRSLESLVVEMPPPAGSTLVPASPHEGITLVVEPQSGYVWPDIEIDEDLTPTPIILLTAPGAMGKSSAALAVAGRLGAPYMDLSKMQVGSSTLTGELAKVLGFGQAASFVDALKRGDTALVLDSTDEAQLAAGRENYLAFLADLAWIMADAEPCQQVILLGRRDSIETTYLSLLDLGFDVPTVEIAPLTHAQAAMLIDETLDRKTEDGRGFIVHREHSGPFGELRDLAFQEVAAALEPGMTSLDDWGRVENFLGYPPVLMALAQRLAVDNPRQESQSRGGAGLKSEHRMRQGELLKKVVEDILDRESEKVRGRLAERLGMSSSDARRSVLYTASEQVSRLLATTGVAVADVPLPASLTATERIVYEDSIGSFLIDHPFLFGPGFANAVFSDYVRAFAVSSPLAGVQIASRSEFLAALPKVGPFFAHFLHSMGAGGQRNLPEDLVDDALHSYALGASDQNASFSQFRNKAVLVLAETGEVSDLHNALIFDITDLSGALQITGPISRFVCFSDSGVILVGPNGHLDVGPSVFISADALVIEAKSVVCVAAGDSLSAFFAAKEVQHDPAVKVVAHPERSLVVNWANPWHQWKPFHRAISQGSRNMTLGLAAQVMAGIRRILLVFGASVRDDPSVFIDKVDRVTLGTNPVFIAVFAALTDMGIVERDGALYRLRVSRLGEFGLSWSSLRGDDPIGALQSLHQVVVDHSALDSIRTQEG